MTTLEICNQMMDALHGKSVQPATLNEDYAVYLRDAPVPTPQRRSLRLFASILIASLKARIKARRNEKSLIKLWEISPHLLKDIGIVLTATGKLPDHLIVAPERVIEHVAAKAPEQIVEAELSLAAATKAAPEPAAVDPVAEEAVEYPFKYAAVA